MYKRQGVYYARKLRVLVKQYRQAGRKERTPIDASVRGWVNHVRYANTLGLRKAIFRQVKL